MRFLVDVSGAKAERIKNHPLIAGQLLTPLTRYTRWADCFAIDNGAFSGFPKKEFSTLLEREKAAVQKCQFVCVPDVVGNARRTLEIWKRRNDFVRGWPAAIVIQDGMEDFEIPWSDLAAVFIGGRDPWKDSQASQDIVKAAKVLGVHVHVGRVNTFKRFRLFHDLGADTCDGSGIAMYDHMLKDIEEKLKNDGDAVLPGFGQEAEDLSCWSD
jgi:hypothetical protein